MGSSFGPEAPLRSDRWIRSRWIAKVLLLLAPLAYGCGAELGGGPTIVVEPFRVVSAQTSPAWSPDGLRIAYDRYKENSIRGIWVVDTGSVETHQILGGGFAYLDWSPDGTLLTMSSDRIYVVEPNGQGLRALTTTGYKPHWSPSGDEIAFESSAPSGMVRIQIVSRDGTRLRTLAAPDTESWREPDWSPDGTRLVHTRYTLHDQEPKLFVMDTTGSSAQQLIMDTAINESPAWSPDGRWIAWSRTDNAGTIWLIKPDGTQAHELTNGFSPAWSPDSRRIVFSRLLYNVIRVFAIDIQTLRERQITE